MNFLPGLLSRTILGTITFAQLALPCSISEPVSNIKLVRDAIAIVRAKAMDYTKPPPANFYTTGVPDSLIRFKIVETLRGSQRSDINIAGYLDDSDDFNDHLAPYKFVRPGGRSGSCFASSYRKGAEFLLFLGKDHRGGLSVYWYALAPVNEQLHSDQDPWLLWVRQMVAKQEAR